MAYKPKALPRASTKPRALPAYKPDEVQLGDVVRIIETLGDWLVIGEAAVTITLKMTDYRGIPYTAERPGFHLQSLDNPAELRTERPRDLTPLKRFQ